MTPKQKLLAGAAVALGGAVAIVLWRRRKDPTGEPHLVELVVMNCECYRVAHYPSGDMKTEKVPRALCAMDPGNRAAVLNGIGTSPQCSDSIAKWILGG